MSDVTAKDDAATGPDESGEDLLHERGARAVRAGLIALVAITIALLAIHPLNSYDVWTHLACGRLIWLKTGDDGSASLAIGLDATVAAGGQTVRFDGKRILLTTPK